MTRRLQLASLVLALVWSGCDNRLVYNPVQWVDVEAGTFNMGTPASEKCRQKGQFKETLHQVTLSQSYQMMITEVTQGQFEAEMGYNPTSTYIAGPDSPVDQVTWHESAAFCNVLSKKKGVPTCYDCQGTGKTVKCQVASAYLNQAFYRCPGYRLPTEAEWEYACRAGTRTAFYIGQATSCEGVDFNAGTIGWYEANSGKTLHKAGKKKANAWGLHDMAGNVWEWVNDWFDADLGGAMVTDPTGMAQPTLGRVLRGGSCEVPAGLLRCGARWGYADPGQRLRFHGFRCVRTVRK